MQATAASFSSSSTSTPNGDSSRRCPYKVFLSFRGEDTRHNFVSHLHKELTLKGIHTFKDDHDLKRGDSLTPSLLQAISGSRVALVVLSEHYASSTWCLEELVKIMECRERNRQLVVPIFYKVDPSDVRNQRGCFGEALKMHKKQRKREKDYEAKMEKWRNALTQVATIAGWDCRYWNEATLIKYIVKDISDKLANATSFDVYDLVAIGSEVTDILLLLAQTSKIKLPSSIEFLSRLKKLDMKGCKHLFQSMENSKFISQLDLSFREKLESVPTYFHRVSSLSAIEKNFCKHLRSIPKRLPPLRANEATGCESLENFSENSNEVGVPREKSLNFDFRKCFELSEKERNNIHSFALSTFQTFSPQEVQFCLLGGEIPLWICNQAVGSSINIRTPSNFATVRTVLCCVVFTGGEHLVPFQLRYRCQFKGDNRNQGHIEDNVQVVHIASSDQTLLCNFKKPQALDFVVDNELSFEFFFEQWESVAHKGEIKVKNCGISFLS